MLAGILICLALGGDSGAPESLVGNIRITGTSFKRVVSVVVDDQPTALAGDLISELERLASIKVEVIGYSRGGKLVVATYRILDIGGGAMPVVGTLVQTDTGLALNDGDGKPIPLSMAARAKKRLQAQTGAKLWVHGESLVSGELKVQRYGVLRDAPKLNGGEPPPVK